MNEILRNKSFTSFIPVKNETLMLKLLAKDPNRLAGIVFAGLGNSSNSTDHVRVTIRFPENKIDSTRRQQVVSRFWKPGPRVNYRSHDRYISQGFMNLQELIGEALVEVLTGHKLDIGITLQHFPYPCYIEDEFLKAIARFLPLVMVIGWIFSVSMTVRSIVYEKELRLKEFMKVMGLSNLVHWLGWFTTTGVIMTISAILLTFVLKVTQILPMCSPTLLFFVILSYVVSITAESFLISVCFGKANVAATSAGIIYFLCYMPFSIVRVFESSITETSLYLLSLFTQVSLAIGCNYIGLYEQNGVGIQWSNLFRSPNMNDSHNLGRCVSMMWLDTLIYLLFTWYIEAIFPGEFGVPQVWYFPFTYSYWFGTHPVNNKENYELECISTVSEHLEAEPTDYPLGVKIKNLSKTYPGADKPAVNSLSINFYEGQITSFLGHNGAGKTTTISILTGMYPPSGGSIYIYDYNLINDMDKVRSFIGLCPQYNTLFEYLTVEEHIYFYGLLKGTPQAEISSEMSSVIKAVNLPAKRTELSMNLSGGMKRKLSVAMAFVGPSRLIILDEPTAGVDPYSRRSIWELIGSCRKNRTIVLTTHHLDEADVLGDRVAVIAQGKLCCVGSNAFLKKTFGSGYNLSLSKAPTPDVSMCYTDNLINFIAQHVQGAYLLSETSTEWLIKLPYDDLGTSSFPKLLQDLNSNMDQYHVSSYGITDVSMEEVFLKVVNDPDSNGTGAFYRNQSDDCDFNVKDSLVTGRAYTMTQFIALWEKRFHYKRRNVKGFIAEMLLPPFFILMVVFLNFINPEEIVGKPLEIHPWRLAPQREPNTLHVFFSNTPGSSFSSRMTQYIASDYGISGTRCMNSSVYSISKYRCRHQYTNSYNWSTQPPLPISQKSPSCDCSKSIQLCPNPASGGPKPTSRLMPTTDFLYNVSGYNISDWLIKTHFNFTMTRFGGFTFNTYTGKAVNFDKLLSPSDSVPGMISFRSNLNNFFTRSKKPSNQTVIWYNNKGFISAPAYLGILLNVALRDKLPPDLRYRKGITFVNHPFKAIHTEITKDIKRVAARHFLLTISVLFALSFIPASFILFLIDEQICHSKHLQLVSGVNPLIYWVSTYSWDIVNYTIPCLVCVIIFVLFDCQVFISSDVFGAFVNILLFYGLSVIPMMYPASFYFDTPSYAFVILSSLNLFVGFVTTLSVSILEILQYTHKDLTRINDILKVVFLCLPQYCLGQGLQDLATIQIDKYTPMKALFGFDVGKAYDWDRVGQKLVILLVQAVLFFAIVLGIEYEIFSLNILKLCQTPIQQPDIILNEDSDVAEERKRVLVGDSKEDPVQLIKLTKEYPRSRLKRPAVQNICFSVRTGECFGLLGVNGAGKTTTFKMLTGHHLPTMGEAHIRERPITGQMWRMEKANKDIGYCPQFDALSLLLTGREVLTFYARLRAIPSSRIASEVTALLVKMRLVSYADKVCGNYSGGNKRKLSTAVALIGSPSVILLDEPTSGMDVGARRFLWSILQECVQEGRSVVLTTHSMEECEALCQRLTIMVNGTLRCLGSVQHLKSKYGDGYSVDIKLKNDDPKSDEVKEMMANKLPDCVLQDCNYTLLQYKTSSSADLAELFQNLQALDKLIERYSVSQTTLDQVFINFAKEQSDDSVISNESPPIV